jgi:hypothetical protein
VGFSGPLLSHQGMRGTRRKFWNPGPETAHKGARAAPSPLRPHTCLPQLPETPTEPCSPKSSGVLELGWHQDEKQRKERGQRSVGGTYVKVTNRRAERETLGKQEGPESRAGRRGAQWAESRFPSPGDRKAGRAGSWDPEDSTGGSHPAAGVASGVESPTSPCGLPARG